MKLYIHDFSKYPKSIYFLSKLNLSQLLVFCAELKYDLFLLSIIACDCFEIIFDLVFLLHKLPYSINLHIRKLLLNSMLQFLDFHVQLIINFLL